MKIKYGIYHGGTILICGLIGLVVYSLASYALPFSNTAYESVVAAITYTQQVSLKHPECEHNPNPNFSAICKALAESNADREMLIKSVMLYCAGKNFRGNLDCSPTPKYIKQVTTSMQLYRQAEVNLKKALKKNE